MKKLFQKQSINQASGLSVLLVALLTVLVLVFSIYNLNKEHEQEIKRIEKQYIQKQKELIKQETKRALNYIAYKHKKDVSNKPLEELQSEIVDAIEQMRDERDGTGYIFIYTFDGINIADPILKENAGKNMLHMKDPNGKEVIYELIEASKKDDGGFVQYVWNKPVINKLAPKISYAASYKPWRWMIGTGIYLDDMKAAIEKKKFDHKRKVSKFIIGILTLATALFFMGMVIYKYFAYTVSDDISYIEKALKTVSSDYQKLDINEIRYEEYQKIAQHINSMAEEIKIQKESLEDLNANLAQKVEEKTKKLKTAKEFAESMVKAQDKFIKNATHEINTPLSIIMTNLDLYNMNNPKNRYLSKIEAGIKIIHNIYNDLSYITKKDRIEYKKGVIDFSTFLQERIDFFNEVAVGNHLELHSDIEPELRIWFNEVELQRVCDNNISNAIKYSSSNQTVFIKLFRDKDMIEFKVTSFGDEIKEPDRLFKRFYREDSARGGFGIGLNIVKEICDKNEVIVKVESKDHQNSFIYYFKEYHEDTVT